MNVIDLQKNSLNEVLLLKTRQNGYKISNLYNKALNWLSTIFYNNLQTNGNYKIWWKLPIAQGSRLHFFSKGFTSACLILKETQPCFRELLIIDSNNNGPMLLKVQKGGNFSNERDEGFILPITVVKSFSAIREKEVNDSGPWEPFSSSNIYIHLHQYLVKCPLESCTSIRYFWQPLTRFWH